MAKKRTAAKKQSKAGGKKTASKKKGEAKKYKVMAVKIRSRKPPPPSIADKFTAGFDACVRAVSDSLFK
jgi:hypothetical protein